MKQISGMNLDTIIRRLQLAKEGAPKAAAKGAMPPLMRQVAKSFAEEKDPNGEKWAELKYKKLKRGHKILEGLKAYFSFFSYNEYLKVSNQKYYTKYHQTGTKRMARRGFLPQSGRPVNKKWQEPLRVAAQKAILSAIKSGGR